jgi:hypothetical protein
MAGQVRLETFHLVEGKPVVGLAGNAM